MFQLLLKIEMLSLWQLTADRGQLAKIIASTSYKGDSILHEIISFSYEVGFREPYS